MALPIDLWLIHPNAEMCDAFRERFAELPNVRVIQSVRYGIRTGTCTCDANAFDRKMRCVALM
jgi:hypothetical protein